MVSMSLNAIQGNIIQSVWLAGVSSGLSMLTCLLLAWGGRKKRFSPVDERGRIS